MNKKSLLVELINLLKCGSWSKKILIQIVKVLIINLDNIHKMAGKKLKKGKKKKLGKKEGEADAT